MIGSRSLKQAKESYLFSFIGIFSRKIDWASDYFMKLGVFLVMIPKPSTHFHTNLTTKLFPQPSKVLRLMMKMTTAGKVLLLMNPLQWESPCLPFSARSVSE